MPLSKVPEIEINNDVVIGGNHPLVLFCGPNVIESEKLTYKIAEELLDITASLDIPFVFKASYDKANRSSIDSFRGPGLKEGLAILKNVKARYKVPVITDVHQPSEVDAVAAVCDVIQIPAFLSRQTDLVIAAAKTMKPIHIKKAQFLAPWDMKNIVDKIKSQGNDKIILCERGTSFGFNNLVVDMTAFPIMRNLGCPVVYDVTHSLQLPTGRGKSTGGRKEFVASQSRAAVAAGIDGLFLEVHPNPSEAKCDGPCCTDLKDVPELLKSIKVIDAHVKEI
jgi:2-dehydro-3-deoxyphosphooctonate aldolase (KDO 8-P synthase)